MFYFHLAISKRMFRLEMSEFIVKGPSLAFVAPDSPRGVGNFPDNKGNKYAMRERVGNSLINWNWEKRGLLFYYPSASAK